MSNHVSSSSGSNWRITKFIIALTGLITAAVTLYVALNNGFPPPDPTSTSVPGGHRITEEPPNTEPTDAPTPTPTDSIPTAAQIARLQQETIDAFKEGRLAEAKILLKEIEEMTNEALRHAPEDTDLLNLDGYHHKNVAWQYQELSMSDQKMDELTEAEQSFRLVISLDDRNAVAWNGLGNVYLLRCNREKAEEYIQTALEINPEYPAAKHDLAIIPSYMEKYCR